LRRIGNSLGVIVPKIALDKWGLGEGDAFEVTTRGLRPATRGGLAHAALDELKRSLALAVVGRFTPREIRAQSLANLHRWKTQGTWVSAYDEWMQLMTHGSDGELFASMLGREENATRLRQSMPFVGLLPQEEVERLYEEAGA
jgi:antitoxin component of MazEF toxin-antitoxin module